MEYSVLARPRCWEQTPCPPWGCGSASRVAVEIRSDPLPPGSLGEGGRDGGRLEKPGPQSLRQRNPRPWGSVAGAEAAGRGAGACRQPWAEKKGWLQQYPGSERSKRNAIICTVFYSLQSNPAAEISQYAGVVRVDITPPFYIGGN